MRRRPVALFLLLALMLLAGRARAVALEAGDLVVSGWDAGGAFIAKVDPGTGARAFVTHGAPFLSSAVCLAVGRDGYVYVGLWMGKSTSINRFDPADGSQSVYVVPMPLSPKSTLITHSDGNFYYLAEPGDIVQMTVMASGERFFSKLTSGAEFRSITEGPDGDLYAAACRRSECSPDPTSDVVAVRYSRGSGAITPAGHGPIGDPRGIAFDRRDSMYVESADDRRVFRFGPDGAAGPLTDADLTFTAGHMVGHPDGSLYLTHQYGGNGRVDRLDPVTGGRTTLADFGPGSNLTGITVVGDWPTPVRHRTWGQVKQIYR